MRALLQRVSKASVQVDGQVVGAIGPGICAFLGIGEEDTTSDALRLADKVLRLRIFPDGAGKMNLSLLETGGALLVVSQFTLYGDARKGNRPSYAKAASPAVAEPLYKTFVERCRTYCSEVATGTFQAHMEVHLINDGPVTLMTYSGG